MHESLFFKIFEKKIIIFMDIMYGKINFLFILKNDILLFIFFVSNSFDSK